MTELGLPYLKPSDLSGQQLALWEEVVARRPPALPPITVEDGGMGGPYNSMLYTPGAGLLMNTLVNELGNESQLTPTIRELTILFTRTYCRCEFRAHAMFTQKQGVPHEIVDAISFNPEHCLALHGSIERLRLFIASLLLTRRIEGKIYRDVVHRFGYKGVTEVTEILGFYSALCFSMSVFEVPPPARSPQPWPD